jgi:hypothetical protein
MLMTRYFHLILEKNMARNSCIFSRTDKKHPGRDVSDRNRAAAPRIFGPLGSTN